MSNNESPSFSMALARIAVGVIFLFFAQFKLFHRDFTHGYYQQSVTTYVQQSSVAFYRPILRMTLWHPVISGYAVGVAEALIGLSMVLGFWVRPFSIVGALFMLNLVFSTWRLPPGTAAWMYVANQLPHIPLLLLFAVFFAHNAGETLGLDK